MQVKWLIIILIYRVSCVGQVVFEYRDTLDEH